jgi:SsrA-binding protein
MKNPLVHMSCDSDRQRKLLLSRRQLKKIYGEMTKGALTLLPIECYFKNNRYFKLVIGLCSKETKYDKREKIKKREMRKDMERAIF